MVIIDLTWSAVLINWRAECSASFTASNFFWIEQRQSFRFCALFGSIILLDNGQQSHLFMLCNLGLLSMPYAVFVSFTLSVGHLVTFHNLVDSILVSGLCTLSSLLHVSLDECSPPSSTVSQLHGCNSHTIMCNMLPWLNMIADVKITLTLYTWSFSLMVKLLMWHKQNLAHDNFLT